MTRLPRSDISVILSLISSGELTIPSFSLRTIRSMTVNNLVNIGTTPSGLSAKRLASAKKTLQSNPAVLNLVSARAGSEDLSSSSMMGNKTRSKMGCVDWESDIWVERRSRCRYVIARWRIGGLAFIHCFDRARRGGCQKVFQAICQLRSGSSAGKATFLILHPAGCDQTWNNVSQVI